MSETPSLRVATTPADPVRSLIPLADGRHPLLFVRRGDGIVGLGEALRLEFRGPDRIREAAAAWREVVSRATVDDPVQIAGSGLVAFGAFAFADESDSASVLVVPEVIVGRRDGVGWITRVSGGTSGDGALDATGASAATGSGTRDASGTGTREATGSGAREATGSGRREASGTGPREVETSALGPEYRIPLLPGELDADGYRTAVSAILARIRTGELDKAVLARDLVGHLPAEADLRRVLLDLALGYPDTWTFAVDGLIGSSPETLVRVGHGQVTARVLAGSIGRGADADADAAAALALATSQKDLDEHRFAVQSVLGALQTHSRNVVASELPFALKLPNLWHLASDVEGTLTDGSTALDLVCELHPTAAVAGTPRDIALEVIRELEPFDRARYGGPVGWVDGRGDGKWAVALRSAEVGGDGTVRAFAGAGVVSESDPDRELAETKLKFRPIVEAFR